uniref:Uncharacterized protein n=1 Tax=Timema genevievae TaxID=629358 RepID=A0A7R9K715_TIMGE|nr:unnamed protein product [Timema genevievae]
METCDISLVKEENIELIKTEPQNEDEFDMCGQSGIKTEVPNLVGDFKDTINYGAQRFQTSDAGMKSPWDVFLPIKEQIKDETDTSNSVDEIVKTEIKLYDSSLGIMNSNMDPVDKSKIKLEQDQSTSSSEISKSNILAQTGSDFPHEGGRKCNTENCTKKADEDIVFHMEAERNVKLQDVLNRLRQEAIVMHMEAERNVKLQDVLNRL